MKTNTDDNIEVEIVEFDIDLLDSAIGAADRQVFSLPGEEAQDMPPAETDQAGEDQETGMSATQDVPQAEAYRENEIQETVPGQDPMFKDTLIEQLTKQYEDTHRMSVELSTDVFTAIGRAKSKAKRENEEALRRVESATSTVEDATGKLKIIEQRYEASKSREKQVKQRMRELPYVGETAIAVVLRQIEFDRNELEEIIRGIPRAEKAEKSARAEAMSALHMIEDPESEVREKKKLLDFAEKRKDLTDYLLEVAKRSLETRDCEAEYEAACREAEARNADYSEAYREYSRASDLLSDVRNYAREKKKAYEDAHRETQRMRKKVDAYQDLIKAEEKKLSAMKNASAVYNDVYAEYQERKKERVLRGRQLEAAREEYARLLDILADARTEAENAADMMYRAEKLSVRDVIETKVTDPDFLYLNQYGALLGKAQADEQAALGRLRRAQKNKT